MNLFMFNKCPNEFVHFISGFTSGTSGTSSTSGFWHRYVQGQVRARTGTGKDRHEQEQARARTGTAGQGQVRACKGMDRYEQGKYGQGQCVEAFCFSAGVEEWSLSMPHTVETAAT